MSASSRPHGHVVRPDHAIGFIVALAARRRGPGLSLQPGSPAGFPPESLLIAIDGPTGSGKSSLARELEAPLGELVGAGAGVELVQIESYVPGWSGLADGVARCREGLKALDRGRSADLPSWDWHAMRPGPVKTWRPASGAIMILEGCGALAAATGRWRRLRCLRVLVEAPEGLRHERIARRDPYHWDIASWERQENLVARAWKSRPSLGPDVLVRHEQEDPPH